MRIAYKQLVERFSIPRPTLIEWQKKSKESGNNWRIGHLQYLRDQLVVEEETKKELNQKAILLDEYFLCLVFLFFEGANSPMSKKEFTAKLRQFSIVKDLGVEYQHPFSRRIWIEQKIDGVTYRIASYLGLTLLVETLTSYQHYCFQTLLLKALKTITKKLNQNSKARILGSTWQELHAYEKVFNLETIKDELGRLDLEFN
ncbi:MAG: hypothetical protein GX780_02350 [Campylobacteraceae bacterium]|nr:hypothetical protein [Campylobacteraceae bacterium]